jgi:hypothetical protein
LDNRQDDEISRGALTCLNVSSRKILAFEQQRCAMSFRAGI